MDLQKMGSFLKELRKEKGLTQEALAEKLYVSSRSVSRWERGNNMPDIETLIGLADFYGVDLVEILDGERSEDEMKDQVKEASIKVSEYEKELNETMFKTLRIFMIVAFVGSVLDFFLDKVRPGLSGKSLSALEFTMGFFEGFTMATLLFGILYSFGFFRSKFILNLGTKCKDKKE